jgi:L-amino acid N-acyltransferase YncA
MNWTLEPANREDGHHIIDIFNHYVENSFAAYPESCVPYDFFELFLKMSAGYPFLAAKDGSSKVLGFGLLRPHNPLPTFRRTAEITCFVAAGHTQRGIGGQILDGLLAGAKEMGIVTILASISSLNDGSIAFHKKMGFQECGRFFGVGRKRGREFDEVWMQRLV